MTENATTGASPGQSNVVTVSTVDGRRRELRPGEQLLVGRPGGGADLELRGDVHLSRRHLVVEAANRGFRLHNISTVNPLYVDGQDGNILPVRPGARWDADRVTISVGTATMVHEERPLTVSCTLAPAPLPPNLHGDGPLRGEPTQPAIRISLAEDAQYFLTAVLLCRPWLRDPLRTSRLPSALELAEGVAHLAGVGPLRPAQLEELERFIVSDLKTLKQKLLDSGVVAQRPVSVAMVASALVGAGLVTPLHLRQAQDDAVAWRHRWRGRISATTEAGGPGAPGTPGGTAGGR